MEAKQEVARSAGAGVAASAAAGAASGAGKATLSLRHQQTVSLLEKQDAGLVAKAEQMHAESLAAVKECKAYLHGVDKHLISDQLDKRYNASLRIVTEFAGYLHVGSKAHAPQTLMSKLMRGRIFSGRFQKFQSHLLRGSSNFL